MKKGYAMIGKSEKVIYYEGKIYKLKELDELQALRDSSKCLCPLVFVNPFRTIKERGCGFKAKGDEPILVLEALITKTFGREQFLKKLRKETMGNIIKLKGEIASSVSDEEFAKQVRQIQDKEIAGGNACQVVLSRKFHGQIKDMSPAVYLVFYKRLLEMKGQYMTFLFNDNDEYVFVGASPECHLRIQGQEITMNPIAGTLRKFAFSDPKQELENFLKDPKEINELFQVLDEELKMMAKICPKGGKIVGPKLRETNAVIHTEYELVGMGNSNINAVAALRETLHAPTLVGSPIESASRIIYRYEQDSRGYYGGQYGVYESNSDLDSAIFIRTAKLSIKGEFIVQAGAGIVKDSIPLKETEETIAKANSFLNVFKDMNAAADQKSYLANVDSGWLEELLGTRNAHLSSFHLEEQTKCKRTANLNGIKITIINNEDNFALMLAHMARHMGCQTEVIDTFQFDSDKISDIVILGPGPGDINDKSNLRMWKLLSITKQLIDNRLVAK